MSQSGFPSSCGLLQVRTTFSFSCLDEVAGATLGLPVGPSEKTALLSLHFKVIIPKLSAKSGTLKHLPNVQHTDIASKKRKFLH